MTFRENGCLTWFGVALLLIVGGKIVGCIIGEISDGASEVIAKQRAKQAIADEKARAKAVQEEAERAAEAAREAEAKRRLEAQNAERQRLAEEKRMREDRARELAEREAAKAEKLRTFALAEAPRIWAATQRLEASIAEQDKRIADLAATLREFGKDPQQDADYKAIMVMREEMVASLAAIRRKLEEAYLASCRFKATPSQKEYAELMRKSLEDGAQAAEQAMRKFERMKVEK